MAQADFTECTNNLSTSVISRGVTSGIVPPAGGGSFIYGFNSLAVTPGGAGLFVSLANFTPMTKGGSVRGAVKRGISGGATGFSPFLFIGLQSDSLLDNGYMLGLSDDDPSKISLVKGSLVSGIPAASVPGVNGVLARSTASFANDTWAHLRLDMIVNLNGDVLLQAFSSDLGAHNVTSPVWVPIVGTAAAVGQNLASFVDDALHVNSGSAPYVAGRGGFGFSSHDVIRRGYFDQFELSRQI